MRLYVYGINPSTQDIDCRVLDCEVRDNSKKEIVDALFAHALIRHEDVYTHAVRVEEGCELLANREGRLAVRDYWVKFGGDYQYYCELEDEPTDEEMQEMYRQLAD